MSKPIIRHCRNCEYSTHHSTTGNIYCEVKYKIIFDDMQRLSAFMCRHYKQKEGAE